MAVYQQVAVVSAPPAMWSTGILDCFDDMDVCLDVYCCAPCAMSRQWDAVDGRPNSLNMLVCCAGYCFQVYPCINCAVRCNIASRFNIDEGGCMSCLVGTFVPSCGMCQQHKELSARGLWPGGTICGNPPPGFVMVAPGMAPMGQQVYQQQQPVQQQVYMQQQQQPVYGQQQQVYGQQQQVYAQPGQQQVYVKGV